MNFGEVRVRYRQQRRGLIRHIILEKLKGNAMTSYIEEQTNLLAEEKDRVLFKEDVMQDLEALDVIRIAGMAVTEDELNIWKSLKTT